MGCKNADQSVNGIAIISILESGQCKVPENGFTVINVVSFTFIKMSRSLWSESALFTDPFCPSTNDFP